MYSSAKFFVPITIVGPALGAGRAAPANRPKDDRDPHGNRERRLGSSASVLSDHNNSLLSSPVPGTLVPRRALGVIAFCNASSRSQLPAESAITQYEAPSTP